MSLKENIYSILVVSAAKSLNSTLSTLLPESTFQPVLAVTDVSTARRVLADRSFDLVLINSPLPDESGIQFAIDISTSKSTVVMVLVKNDLHDEIYDKVVDHGVFTLPKPTSRTSMERALAWMISSREKLRHFEKKSMTIEQKMEEIRLVNRAKWLLISEQDMTEPDAHRYIEKQAMDMCVPKRTIAENIIKIYS